MVKMKLTANQKLDAGMALNLTELSKVTGWGVSSLRRMELPLICGKMRAEDFWRVLRRRQEEQFIPDPVFPSCLEADRDLRSTADKFRAPRNSSARRAASPCRAGCRPHNTA